MNLDRYNLKDIPTETLIKESYILEKIVERISYPSPNRNLSFQQQQLFKPGHYGLADRYSLRAEIRSIFERWKGLNILADYTFPEIVDLIRSIHCEPNENEIRLYRDFVNTELNDRNSIIPERVRKSTLSQTTKEEYSDIQWPPEFKWDETENNYLVGDGKMVIFSASVSTRKDIFRALIKKQGLWKTVRDISKEVNKTETYVRSVAKQLDQKIKDQGLGRYLKIEPRDETGRPGAYRTVPYP